MEAMGSTVGKLAVVDFGVQWLGFTAASVLRTEKFYDLTGSLTFVMMTVLSLRLSRSMRLSLSQVLQSSCVLVWAIRLGLFLFTRILKEGEDRRFRTIKTSAVRFFIVWTLQGVWVLLTLLPTLLANLREARGPDETLDWRQKAGWALWAVGFLLEVVADHQKSQFRADPDNAGRFITSGLWALSRHPNYLGEVLLWAGLGLAALPRLRGWERLTAAASPLFVFFLLTRVSGLPLLEQAAQRRWGREAAYQEYVRHTALLVPFIW